jgi:diguanylate cyclase (GGDEF)-like protein/hemerythrin-like metal-binding protein/PAS domain S-box-containing protein
MVLTASLALMIWDGISKSISKEYVRLYTSEMVERLKAHMGPEIALSLKAANTEVINQWMNDEFNPVLRQQALSELVEYAKILKDQNLFIAISGTNHMYFVDSKTTLAGFEPSGELKKSIKADVWFFNTMSSKAPYLLNIDEDRFIENMRVWINVKVEQEEQVLGVVGTGLFIHTFLGDIFTQHDDSHVKSILINQYGDVQLDSEINRIRQNSFDASAEVNQTIYSYIKNSAFHRQIDAYLFTPTDSLIIELNNPNYQYAALSPIKGTNWHVVTLFSTHALYASAKFLPVILIILSAALFLGLVINHIAKVIFVEPFEKLNASIELKEAIRSHKLYGLDRQDEFGALAHAVEKMSDRLMRSVPVGMFLLDESMNFVYGNPNFLSQMGYTDLEAFQKQYKNNLIELFANPDEGKRIINLLNTKRDNYDFEVELQTCDQTPFWAEIRMTRIDHEKSGWQYEGILLNIQGKKEHESILETLANRDQLTGIYNRHYFDEVVGEAVSRSDRYGNALSMVIFDLDFFKQVNDTWGHVIGDQVLVNIAAEALSCLRQSDVLVRWGGEEFAILMPGTSVAGAFQVAEKIRLCLEGINHESAGKVTASFGVAERQAYESSIEWFERVDQAMFKAKSQGRNMVVSADEVGKSKNAIVQLVWQDTFNSGNTVIDEQHKKLFVLCNALMNIATGDHPHELEVSMFKAILQHVNDHLIDEENILLENGYPSEDYLTHLKHHQSLRNSMLELQDKLRNKAISAVDVFLTLTNEVVVGHLLTEDVKFFPCLRGTEPAG